jgi:OmpA family
MRKIHVLLWLIHFAIVTSRAQNLIPNFDFEQSDVFDSRYGDWSSGVIRNEPQDWYSLRSCDYYGGELIPVLCSKQIEAQSGNYFIGLGIERDSLAITRFVSEYAQVKLLQPLEKEKEYRFSFYIQSCKKAKYICSEIGVYFSSDRPQLNKTLYQTETNEGYDQKSILFDQIPFRPQLKINVQNVEYAWKKFDCSYIAEGGEMFFTLGFFGKELNFYPAANTEKCDEPIVEHTAYYFLDNFSLSEKTQEIAIDVRINSKINTSESSKSSTVFFATSQSYISEDGENTLLLFSEAAKLNPSSKITIYSYADTTGTNSYNLALCERRAEAVLVFLRKAGVNNKYELKIVGEIDCDDLSFCRKVVCEIN